MVQVSPREIGALLLPQVLYVLLWLLNVARCRVFCLEIAYFYSFSCIVESKSGRNTQLQWTATALLISVAAGILLGHVFPVTANAHACATIFVTAAMVVIKHPPSKTFVIKSILPCGIQTIFILLSLMSKELNGSTEVFLYGIAVFVVFSLLQYVDDHLPFRSLELNFVKCVASFAIILAIEIFCPQISARWLTFPVLEFFRSGLNLFYHPQVNRPAHSRSSQEAPNIIQKAIGIGVFVMYIILSPRNLVSYVYVVVASIAWKIYQTIFMKGVSRYT